MNPPCTAEGHLAILARQGVVATAAEPEQFEEPIQFEKGEAARHRAMRAGKQM